MTDRPRAMNPEDPRSTQIDEQLQEQPSLLSRPAAIVACVAVAAIVATGCHSLLRLVRGDDPEEELP